MSIKFKLYLTGIVALVGLGLVFIINEIGARQIDRAFQVAHTIQQSEVHLLQARRNEKDFLARKNLEYRKKLDNIVDMSLEELSAVAAAEPEMAAEANNVSSQMQLYKEQFAALTDLVVQLGLSEDKGLSGSLRDAIHKAEAIISAQNDNELLALMLTLRRHEKDYMLRSNVKYIDKFKTDHSKMLGVLNASTAYPEQTKAEMLKYMDAYLVAFTNYASTAEQATASLENLRKTAGSVEPALEQLVEEIQAIIDAQRASTARVTVIVESATALLLALLIFWVIRSIVGNVTALQFASRKVAKGDYDACAQISFTGELESLRLDIVSMVQELKRNMEIAAEKERHALEQSGMAKTAMEEAHKEKEHASALLTTMKDVAAQAAAIAGELTSASDELSAQSAIINEGAELQKQQTEEVATAMEQMNATVLDVSSNASHAAEGAEEARRHALSGASIVDNVIQATTEAHTKSVALTSSLDELGERAQAIGQIMSVITDIADQTNLLALNAAIEAARAGEAGRGFAVVADEVRKLAEKTMNATGEVRNAITGIQEGTKNNIDAMHQASEVVRKSTELTKTAGESLSSIVQITNTTADQMRSIATASEEQSATSEQITRSTEEISSIAEKTSQNTELATEAIHRLNTLIQKLNGLITRLNAV
ncbi:methyl-accepting chemotaxis protein [Desulfovibrio subterraneus]|uniref:Methyl-accepting chemotaxis protein n=1 Tax=Desulfovibrio subterraneus TaxID=2718620 RepID=A0A7J0BIT9_9BACT|nr:methyl-accepting chemotaxis protein [Desulfovibrio subterraneus]GFM33683.1 hypothetical protein DSM101010T_20480 [Desulfovibrio subterraneus]